MSVCCDHLCLYFLFSIVSCFCFAFVVLWDLRTPAILSQVGAHKGK
jgi:hypothetical protein